MKNFIVYWQNLPCKITPVAFYVVDFPVHYYGLMYILAFIITYKLVIYRINNEPKFYCYYQSIEELITFIILGIFLGGRIGYAIFYNFEYYIKNPLDIILPFNFTNGFIFTGFSGMSYHGGLLGSILATLIFTKLHNIDFLETADLIIPAVPLGYTFGRIGNFINGELYGRPTSLPIGMYFPLSGLDKLRHPSQLYEAIFEGLFIFTFLWFLKNKICLRRGLMLGLYLITYGLVRFIIEYLRQPDYHIGFVFLSFSMGQVLCFFMIIIGCWITLHHFK